jgi:hypothetical protein
LSAASSAPVACAQVKSFLLLAGLLGLILRLVECLQFELESLVFLHKLVAFLGDTSGDGTYTSAATNTTAQLAASDPRVVFTMWFGSYFGDWDSHNNFLRATLGTAIGNNFSSLAGLFGVQGTSSNSLLSYVSSDAKSQPGNYQVNITAAATQGSATADNAPAASTTGMLLSTATAIGIRLFPAPTSPGNTQANEVFTTWDSALKAVAATLKSST